MKLKDNKIYNVREYTSREMVEVYINKKIEEMRNEKHHFKHIFLI